MDGEGCRGGFRLVESKGREGEWGGVMDGLLG